MKVKVQKRCLNKKSTLVENEKRFKRACEQIVQLNYSLDALQQRYNVLAVIELKQVLKIVEDLADYIALGVTGEIEKCQWSGY
jgi:hypothetical protein